MKTNSKLIKHIFSAGSIYSPTVEYYGQVKYNMFYCIDLTIDINNIQETLPEIAKQRNEFIELYSL